MGARTSPTRGWLRLLRGTSVALVSTVLAAAGHGWASGSIAGLGTLAVLGGLTAVLMTGLADRRPSPAVLLATIGAAQFVLHGLMEIMGTHPHQVTIAPNSGRPGPMIAVHVLAAIASAVLLARADDLIFLVVAVLGRVVGRRIRPRPVTGAVVLTLPAPLAAGALSAFLHAFVVGPRGPPVLE